MTRGVVAKKETGEGGQFGEAGLSVTTPRSGMVTSASDSVSLWPWIEEAGDGNVVAKTPAIKTPWNNFLLSCLLAN